MNFDKLMPIVVSIIIAAAIAGELETLQRWVWKSQTELLYHSRASNWGSPSIFNHP